ncbi:hypothetical protein B0H10DRAFT_1947552 [Mycena sp. CBHHK59/15]|nr:hypothetical protein B0H10DRAFT_1947552 [Mycena sp. CBHHK59/15]
MKHNLLVLFSMAAVTLAASVSGDTFPLSNIKTIDAASYKAAANGTLSLAELSGIPLRRRQLAAILRLLTNAGPNECVNLASDLNDQVSSFGPDPNQSCTMFAAANCSPSLGIAVGPIVAPGVADLSQPFNIGHGQIVNGFNDVLSSYSNPNQRMGEVAIKDLLGRKISGRDIERNTPLGRRLRMSSFETAVCAGCVPRDEPLAWAREVVRVDRTSIGGTYVARRKHQGKSRDAPRKKKA